MSEMELLRAKVKQAGGSFRKYRNSNLLATVNFGLKKYKGNIRIIYYFLFSDNMDAITWRLKEELV